MENYYLEKKPEKKIKYYKDAWKISSNYFLQRIGKDTFIGNKIANKILRDTWQGYTGKRDYIQNEYSIFDSFEKSLDSNLVKWESEYIEDFQTRIRNEKKNEENNDIKINDETISIPKPVFELKQTLFLSYLYDLGQEHLEFQIYHDICGLSVNDIANLMNFDTQYVEKVIQRNFKMAVEKEIFKEVFK